jgi:membrane protein DedA with SNARE-associated domain
MPTPDILSSAIIAPETTQAAVSTLGSVTEWVVQSVDQFGYAGVFVMTFFEANFLPLTSELSLIPAGYLAFQGKMDLPLVYLVAMAGLMSGAIFNYWISYHYGRRFFNRYGKYFLFNEKKLQWIEHYFESHGPISIFSGRLIPGLRHFISFPAGLSRMNFKKFMLYTLLGGSIWIGILTLLGYFIGHNHTLIKKYIADVTWMILALVAVGAAIYIWQHRKGKNK